MQLQKCDNVGNVVKKTRQREEEMKEWLKKNHHGNKDLNEKGVKNEKSGKRRRHFLIIRTYKEIIKTKKKKIICSACRKGIIFKKFKEKKKFVRMTKNFNFSKSAMIFKINIMKLVDKYPKLIN